MEIIDNKSKKLYDDLISSIEDKDTIAIMVNSFSIFMFDFLDKAIEKVDKIQILISTLDTKNFFDDEFSISAQNRLKQLSYIYKIKECLENKKIFIRKADNIPFFCIITKNFSYSISGPCNQLDAKSLGCAECDNLELPIIKLPNDDNPYFKNKFSEIWNSKKTCGEEFIKKLEESVTVTPNDLYYYILNKIIDKSEDSDSFDLKKNHIEDSQIWKKMFSFQKDAATQILQRLQKFGICILADEVGLGKTFTALGIIKQYEMQGKNVLVLCPKKLENNWMAYTTSFGNLKTNIFVEDNFKYHVYFHTDLNRKGKSHGIDLNTVQWDNYGLVVIDESHNFRTGTSDKKDANGKPNENRYSFLMNKVIKAGCKSDLLLLSATPVNNNFKDLKNQLNLAYENTSDIEKIVEKSVGTLFSNADSSFRNWSKNSQNKTIESLISDLDPKFIKLLETTEIARSRKHIKEFYSDSNLKPFPTRLQPINISEYTNNNTDYEKIASLLLDLTLTVYTPYVYIKDEKKKEYLNIFTEDSQKNMTASGRAKGLCNLMRANVLKRLESSTDSFIETLKYIERKIENALSVIDEYKKTKKESNIELDMIDDDNKRELISDKSDFDQETESELYITKNIIKIADMNYDRWEEDLKSDLFLIQYLINENTKSIENDCKLQKLKDELNKKINNPINGENKKVIIFTAFSHTAKYLYNKLKDEFKPLHKAVVTGTYCESTLKTCGNDFNKILTFFSPKSKNKETLYPNESGEIDILIATDCISEGQNLQDCDYLINYDIHWNPVRIIQRFGRIDRIGSDNEKIQLVNFWPDKNLDFYIKLKNRVEAKMTATVIAGAGVGNVLNNAQTDFDFRAETIRKDINNEKLSDENIQIIQDINSMEKGDLDPKNTFTITDYGFAGYKTDFHNYGNKAFIETIPNGIICSVQSKSDCPKGEIFIFKEKETTAANTRANTNKSQIYPYRLIYMDNNGNECNFSEQEIVNCIRLTCRGNNKALNSASVKVQFLDKALEKLNDCIKNQGAQSLFASGGTTNSVAQPMELISTIVIS